MSWLSFYTSRLALVEVSTPNSFTPSRFSSYTRRLSMGQPKGFSTSVRTTCSLIPRQTYLVTDPCISHKGQSQPGEQSNEHRRYSTEKRSERSPIKQSWESSSDSRERRSPISNVTRSNIYRTNDRSFPSTLPSIEWRSERGNDD